MRGETPVSAIDEFDYSSMMDDEVRPPRQQQDDEHDGHAVMDSVLRRVPRCIRFDNAPLEATGLSVDIFARATILMSSIFLGPALLQLAAQACNDGSDDATANEIDENCRVHGFRPSSVLTNIAVVSGLLVSLLLPLFGAIVDHTPYRKQVGAYTAAGLVVLKLIEVGVGPSTWFAVAWLQVVTSLLYNPHNTAIYAYLAELSSDSSEQSYYNTRLISVMYVSTLLFLFEVLGLSALLGVGDVGTARIALLLTSCTSAILFWFVWNNLFRDRPALAQVPAHQTLLTCGFAKVLDTTRQIVTTPQLSSLKWFMVSMSFGEAGAAALVTVATTFMTQVLEMNASEIGLSFLVTLLCGIPGSKLGGWIAAQSGQSPLNSAMWSDVYLIAITSLAALTMTTPEHKNLIYLFCALWGIGIAWLPPMHTTTYISLIPTKKQEAQYMGMYLLCSLVLSWLPPLLFTLLNEAGWAMGWGMASLNLFFGMGWFCMYIMRQDYAQAVALAKRESCGSELQAPPPSSDEACDAVEHEDRVNNDDDDAQHRPIL